MIPFAGSSGLALALLLLSAEPLSGAPADAGHPRRSKPIAELYTLFSTDDYPAGAIANGEQGTVAFDLSIGLDGRVSDCLITSSSGSPVLDATSCQLLVERARFEPATDASGKPVVDSHTSRIVWRLPEEGEPPSSITAAVQLWSACVSGEAGSERRDLLIRPCFRRGGGPSATWWSAGGRRSGKEHGPNERKRQRDLPSSKRLRSLSG